MKQLLIIAMLLATTTAFAADTASTTAPIDKGATQQQKFEATKSKRLQKISGRVAELQKAQACVEAATDYNGLAGCDSPRFKARRHKAAEAAPASGK